ncbi:MAG: DapH/DapD/GlmU-related protein, partial [Thermoleophilaceae bacterium]
RERGRPIAAHRTSDTDSALGVNTRADLFEAQRRAHERILIVHALGGVTFTAPDTVAIDAGVEIGPDTTIEAGVTLRGTTTIGSGATIGPQTTITDSSVGDGVRMPHSFLLAAQVGDRATIGPFAYLRPGAVIGEGAKIGTFVEIKNSTIGARTKVPHLSYLGDADVGEDTNIGAGNVTANYDGARKHRTKIGKRVKTGVDTTFVAPVSVGDDAYTGAGSVIREDVPDGALGISRPKEQGNVEGYSERKRAEQETEE